VWGLAGVVALLIAGLALLRLVPQRVARPRAGS
jgi:hypothetical protein